MVVDHEGMRRVKSEGHADDVAKTLDEDSPEPTSRDRGERRLRDKQSRAEWGFAQAPALRTLPQLVERRRIAHLASRIDGREQCDEANCQDEKHEESPVDQRLRRPIDPGNEKPPQCRAARRGE